MRYLYIAEKMSSMQAVKEAYKQNNSPLGPIDFLALSGHVCGYYEPKLYDEWNVPWRDIHLPMVPKEFKIKCLRKDLVDRVKDTLKQNKYDAIIVGTDSDVEGNGIYALLEKYLHLEKYTTLRFYETDLTDKGIMASFRSLTDFHTNPRDYHMTQAYFIRSQFDWLVGMNLTVAYSVKTNLLMRVGRVKAPTLKLVFDNCEAIDNFTQKESFIPVIKTDPHEIVASAVDKEGNPLAFDKQEEAQAAIDALGDKAVIVKTEKRTTKKLPAQFYKLTDIQVEAGQKYGYSPDKTLEILQTLYEEKILSYPRTDGRYVSSEKAREFPSLLRAVAVIPGMEPYVDSVLAGPAVKRVSGDKRYVNDAEVNKKSHDALIPTGKIPNLSALKEEERNVCIMIYKRFLSAFLDPLVEEKMKISLAVDDMRFEAKGSRVISKGFAEIFDRSLKELVLPDLPDGTVLGIKEKGLHRALSRPPKRFTQATLLDAMENIQKYMQAGELKDTMREASGIGQPSSRASIIHELIASGYIVDKKGLYITDKGKQYIGFMNGSILLDPELSAQWELHLKHIREGSEDFDRVESQILDFVNGCLSDLEKQEIEPAQKTQSGGDVLDVMCPSCGKPMRKMNGWYGCYGYPQCKITVGKISGKMLSENQLKSLLEKGRTSTIKGFVSKNGKKFDAALEWTDGKAQFVFEDSRNEDGGNTLGVNCPLCGNPLRKMGDWYSCSGYPDCRFGIGKICGKLLTVNQMKALFNEGHTSVIKGFTSKSGKKFDAALEWKDEKVQFVFEHGDGKESDADGNRGDVLDVNCPVCGKPIKKRGDWYSCSGYPDCKFGIGKICGKVLSKSQVKSLLTKGRTSVIKGFVSKAGKKFDAALIWKDGKVQFEFDHSGDSSTNNGNRRELPDIKCPSCGKPMLDRSGWYSCSGYPDCKFSVGEICGKRLSESQLKELCETGKTSTIYGFVSKAGKEFDAALEWKDGKVQFSFDHSKRNGGE